MKFDELDAALRCYAKSEPEPSSAAADFLQFLHSAGEIFERSHLSAHFTASAWLVSADGDRALLMHHRKLGRWLQPGGHADGDSDLARVALREAQEETGIEHLALEGGIFDLDRHRIAARGDEPAHDHYDVRYVVRATDSECFVGNGESLALAWRPIGAMAQDLSLDGSLRRMAHKWLSRRAAGN